MAFVRNLLGRGALSGYLRRAQTKLASGAFDQAQRIVAEGLTQYPGAESLTELELTIRRAQARTGMQSLKERIARTDEPRAYEELIALYRELGLTAEARREAFAYCSTHPDRDAPHLLLGEMSLDAFFHDLQARDGQTAHQRLRRAAALDPLAVKPRLYLAELYYCIGADRLLHTVGTQLAGISQEDPMLEPVLEAIREVASETGPVEIDGLFERIEVDGELVREPESWMLRERRSGRDRLDEEHAKRAVDALIRKGAATEVALLLRSGRLLAHAKQAEGEVATDEDPAETPGIVDVARTVARTVSRYARELDLGAFKRCTVQGRFGILTIGETDGLITGARWRANPEPRRLWDRVAVNLEDFLGGKHS